MNIEINNIVHQLFQKDELQQVSENELQQFVTDYPYAAVGHLLLTKKRNSTNTNGFENYLNRTSLYFRNPLWLQCLLNEKPTFEVNEIPVSAKSFAEDVELQPAEILHQPTQNLEETEPVTTTIKEELQPSVSATTENAAFEPEETKPVEEPPAIASPKQKIDTDELVFQSYHTIDYFASQGIKLQKADLTKDKLGHQLKSFTEWLRTMKRLPAPEVDAATKLDDATQASIQQIAEHSIEEKEVVTEAMAEVWAKQGNKAKAWDLYHKLGLLYPDKRPYFAAKIEQLKDL